MASSVHAIAVFEDPSLPPGVDSDELMGEAVALLAHLESKWTRFRADSDISVISRLGAAGGGYPRVDPYTLTLLEVMVDGYQFSGGRFDPTQLRAITDAGYVCSIEDPTKVSVQSPPTIAVGSRLFDLELDYRHNTVNVPAGLVLDAGGIGKGLAGDLAVSMLIGSGAAGALVSVGGDISCHGEPPDAAGWLIDVEDPEVRDQIYCRLALNGGGVATSSTRSRTWRVGGELRHHQIDPRTARCSDTDLTSVTVVAPNGWLAEIHATAALGVGSDEAISYGEAHGLSLVAHCSDGRILASPDFQTAVEVEERAEPRR
ncbi:MAG: FAD:protein FMN transferase [Acidimicrobiales bacterium]|nr:FAD:protein FMN transferase [Acidimicrobiales bacterium]